MLKKYLSIPFLLHGRTFEGCDCYGLLMLYFENELGIVIKDFIGKSTVRTDADRSNNILCLDNSEDEWLPVELDDIRPNDILGFRNKSITINHVGIVIDPRFFLHTFDSIGCAASKISTWRSRLIAAYRHRGLVE